MQGGSRGEGGEVSYEIFNNGAHDSIWITFEEMTTRKAEGTPGEALHSTWKQPNDLRNKYYFSHYTLLERGGFEGMVAYFITTIAIRAALKSVKLYNHSNAGPAKYSLAACWGW